MLLLWILGVVHKMFFGQREGANTNEPPSTTLSSSKRKVM
jgi:hypothetical protein